MQAFVSVSSILQKGNLRSREAISGKRFRGLREPEISTVRFQDDVTAWPLVVLQASLEHMKHLVQKYVSEGPTVCQGRAVSQRAHRPRPPQGSHSSEAPLSLQDYVCIWGKEGHVS